jgi:DNA polymerase III epsilon subunit-like protein
MPKLITFLTTETDGLHEDKSTDPVIKKNLYKYAHMVKLTYHQGTYKDGKISTTLKKSFIIKPEHFIFPKELTKINGLTHEKLVKKGSDLDDVMEEFVSDVKKSSIIIGHNLPFHMKTIMASIFRSGVSHTFSRYTMIDIINYNHNIEKPTLKNISKEILGNSYEEKSRNFQIVMIKKIFAKLYHNMEKEVKQSTS